VVGVVYLGVAPPSFGSTCCFLPTSSDEKNRLLVVDEVVDSMMRSWLNLMGNLSSCPSGRCRPRPPTVIRHASGDVACCFSSTSSVKKNRLLVVDEVVNSMMHSCLNFTGNLLSYLSGRRRPWPPTYWLHFSATVGGGT
jgi:hypothetical protein